MYRTELIQAVIDQIKATAYLEIGVCGGKNFREIRCKTKWGVDPIPADKRNIVPLLEHKEGVHYFQMTSDRYFDTMGKNQRWDVIFIDGMHTADQAWVDFCNAAFRITKGGVIIMHDCNPTTKEMQMVPQVQKSWTGDVWKAFYAARSVVHDLKKGKSLCVNDDYGLGVFFMDGPMDVSEDSPDPFLIENVLRYSPRAPTSSWMPTVKLCWGLSPLKSF